MPEGLPDGNSGLTKSELLYGKTGYFDWTKKRPLTALKAGFSADFLFTGFTATFGTGQVAEPHSLGTPCETNCKELILEPNDCITNVVVGGKDHVRKLQIETKLRKQYTFGSTEQGLSSWNQVNTGGKCITGLWGVYQSTSIPDQKGLLAIGFYFEGKPT